MAHLADSRGDVDSVIVSAMTRAGKIEKLIEEASILEALGEPV